MENMLTDNKNSKDTNAAALSEEETKQYLTPFAFKMDKSLFGLPLASPEKRGIALLIDFSLIAVLSGTTGNILALAIAITLYYLGNKKRAQARGKTNGYKRRAILRFIAGFMLFVIILDTLPSLLDDPNEPQVSIADESLSMTESIALTATAFAVVKKVADSNCQAYTCWESEFDSLAKHLAMISYQGKIKISKTQLNELFVDLSKETKLPLEEQNQLTSILADSYDQEYLEFSRSTDFLENDQSLTDISVNDLVESYDKDSVTTEKNNKPVYSLIEWVKGIIDDLGLGFGWAAFYFTVFISLNSGQTLGKKILGIKVLQLDGTPLSIWDSFGRYGGYGAGLATGLLGFIQIYWDPNKQAIHDQISSTVVIDVNKKRLGHNE